MKKNYYVQVNDYMTPARVRLTEEEAETVMYVLQRIVEQDEDALVEIKDEDGEVLYGNYDEWFETHRD